MDLSAITTTTTTRDDAAARNRFENFKLGKGLPSTAPLGASKHGHSRSHSRNLSISSSFSFPPPSKSTTVNDIPTFSFPLSNASVNSATSSSTTSPPSLSPTIPPPCPSPTSPNLVPSSKRNSHHRRRSSVSTRHESAELMGVSLPDIPVSASEGNINLGEKDSIRRRALWALEGKPDVAFNKVEIPDISTSDMDKIIFDLSSKSASVPSYGNALNSMMGSKRDSFKLLGPSSSAKDQLHTLVEEEEEEDDSADASKEESIPLPASTSAVKENVPPPALSLTKPTPSKPRPSNLNLRPLSLTPDTLNGGAPGLPSPSPTPSPRSGLRELSLTPSSSIDDTTSSASSATKQSRRASLVISPTLASRRPILNLALEHLENSAAATSTCDEDSKPTRRSSISYKRSSHGSVTTTNIAGLPTPEMTPTFGRRYSNASLGDRESISSLNFGSARTTNNNGEDDGFFPAPPTQTRPLSASEQHFLFKSHNALLARITDLERALSMRRRESGGGYSNGGSSRPMSVASNRSSSSDGGGSARGGGMLMSLDNSMTSEPSDEMLQLIADLKAERDELKRDADGWRTRVGDMENQIGMLAKRIENERRDAWVARSRVGLLEVEKSTLGKKLEAVEELQVLRMEEQVLMKKRWEEERVSFMEKEEYSRRRVEELERELETVRKELEETRESQKEAERFVDPLATPTPRSFESYAPTHGLGFASVDSESSVTDVESDSSDNGFRNPFAFKLGAVHEEPEFDYSYSEDTYDDEEEENALAGYEDEGEEDTDMSLQSSSSYGSEDDLPRTVAHLQEHMNAPSSPSTPKPNQVFTPPRPSHGRRATLSKTWKFPFGGQAQMTPQSTKTQLDQEQEEEDRFFGCLDDSETDRDDVSMPSSPSAYSYEKSKGIFASGFKLAPSDDNASFFMPGLGFPADDEEEIVDDGRLAIVAEESEEEEDDTTEDSISEPEHTQDEEDTYDEEEDNMFGNIGGIQITFTPPQDEEVKEERKQIQLTSPVSKRTSPPPMLPALDFGFGGEEEEGDEDDTVEGVIPFSFGRSLMDERQPLSDSATSSPSASPPPPMRSTLVASPPPIGLATITPPSSIPRVQQRAASPSMIPRPASPMSMSSIPRPVGLVKASATTSATTPTTMIATPTKISQPIRAMTLPMSPTSYITPPTKRGGTLPSFIPTPVSSPSPIRSGLGTASRVKVNGSVPTSTFIRQPTRKPLLPATALSKNTNTNANTNMNANNMMNKSQTSGNTNANVVSTMDIQDRSSSSYRYFSVSSPPPVRALNPARGVPVQTSAPSFYDLFDLSGGGGVNGASSSAQMKSVDFGHEYTLSNGSSVSSADSERTVQVGESSTPTPSISEMVTSPFKSLTSFIPMAWASSASSTSTSTTDNFDDDDVFTTPRASAAVKRSTATSGGYVSREQQLRKLHMRMQVEGVVPMSQAVGMSCRNCDGDLVFI